MTVRLAYLQTAVMCGKIRSEVGYKASEQILVRSEDTETTYLFVLPPSDMNTCLLLVLAVVNICLTFV